MKISGLLWKKHEKKQIAPVARTGQDHKSWLWPGHISCTWSAVHSLWIALFVSGLLGGCATTDTSSGAITPNGAAARTSPHPAGNRYPKLTANGADYDTLGQLVRGIGESGERGGIVLVAGLEERLAPQVEVTRDAYAAGLEKLVGPANCLVDSGAFYQFVYPPGYEALLDVSVWDQVHSRFQGLKATFAVGAGTDMYNALALLSETLGVTIIADNAIADVWCGELFLHDAPAATIVEALLQSARVVPGAFVVESTEHFIFLRSTANRSKSDTCVNRDSLSPAMRSMLERVVDLRLPTRDGAVSFQYEAMPLQVVLDDLAVQMGITVTADAALADFPVNQAVFLGLPISDVLDLIIRQWPVAGFGYRADAQGIQFCANCLE